MKDMKNRIMLATFAAWVVPMVATCYWRIFYAWRVGSFFKFMFHDVPILLVALVVVLSVEGLFLRRSRRGS